MFELLLTTSGKIKPVELIQYVGYEKIADLDIPLHGAIPYIWNDKLFIKGGGTDVSSSDPGLRRFKLDGTFENNKNLNNYIYHTNPAQDQRTGRVYLINGRSNGSWSSSMVHTIDPAAETIANLGWSTPRGNYGNSAVYDEEADRIYVQFHDSNQFGYYTSTGVYQNNPKGFPATSLSGAFMFKHKGYIYVMGGWGSKVSSNPDHIATFDAGSAMTSILRLSIATQQWEVYDTLPTAYHGGNQGAGNYHEGIFSYISWSGGKLGAVRYDVSGKRFIRFDTGISYRNATGVVGHKGELYLVGGCSIPLGSTNPPFGRKAETKTEIYKFRLPVPLPPSDKWEYRASMPEPRRGAGYVSIGNSLYVYGGSTDPGGVRLPSLIRYDLLEDKWVVLGKGPETKPVQRSDSALTTDGKTIYMFGGNSQTESRGDNDFWKYEIATDSWTKLAPTGTLPAGRLGHAMFYKDGKVYLLGGQGIDSINIVMDLAIYDIAGNVWSKQTTAGTKPLALRYHRVALVGDDLFMFGGYSSSHSKSMYRLNMTTWEWQLLGAVPAEVIARSWFGMMPSGTDIYITGGGGSGNLKDLWRYNTLDDTWFQLPDANEVIYDSAYGLLGNVVVAAGGVITARQTKVEAISV